MTWMSENLHRQRDRWTSFGHNDEDFVTFKGRKMRLKSTTSEIDLKHLSDLLPVCPHSGLNLTWIRQVSRYWSKKSDMGHKIVLTK